MFIVLLKFSDDTSQARELAAAHGEWIRQGLEDGIFLLVGSLQPRLGGGVLAHRTTLAELEARVSADPFVAHGVVRAEILELIPSKGDARLDFLLHSGS